MKNYNISANFQLSEFQNSATAKAKGIDNTIPDNLIPNVEALVKNILQPIRDKWGSGIKVTSGYRCPKLNIAVSGAKNSQHCTADAADIKAVNGKNNELHALISKMIKTGEIQVGQIIQYTHKGCNPILWVHVSNPRKGKANNQFLHLYK